MVCEHEENKDVQQSDWKSGADYPEKNWRLYNIDLGCSVLNDLNTSNPAKIKELSILYDGRAKRAGIFTF